jgi:lipid II:glycine glycyltransferase (peptidoglycan interpeptide bridge formation enzyme)
MDKREWNEIIRSFPETQLLQLWEWGEVKEKFGWKASQYVWKVGDDLLGAALILEREIRIPIFGSMKMLYIPKGPLMMDWADENARKIIFEGLREIAVQRNAFLLKIEPEVVLGYGESGDVSEIGGEIEAELKNNDWIYSNEQIQFRNTAVLDISADEDGLLAGMKQKTRYNVRLATRKGVSVKVGTRDDFESIFSIYTETAIRDGFAVREKKYYFSVWNTFYDERMLSPLIAEVEGEIVAAVMLFHSGEKSWYIYGMSSGKHRNKMPTYLLQWEAIRTAKGKGCKIYDMWGAPEKFGEMDPLWGVYRMKKGLGGKVVRTIGSYDLPLKKFQYWLYTRVWPRLMDLIRLVGNRKTRMESDL